MKISRSILAVAVLTAAGTVHSAVISFQFVGTVTGGPLAAVGEAITGNFSYDVTTPANYMYGDASRSISSYSFATPFQLVATVTGHQLAAQGFSATVFDNMGGNTEDMIDITGGNPSVDGVFLPSGSFGFRLASASGYDQVLHGSGLPVSFDIAAFNVGSTLNYGWLNSDGGQSGRQLSFAVNSITAVPVPAAAWLFGSGLLGLLAAARRKGA